MKNNQGFTLIELMIVVEIIAIIAAIAVPNYIRTRIQANEASAIASLRVILDAETSYNTQHYVYADDITDLTSASPPFWRTGCLPTPIRASRRSRWTTCSPCGRGWSGPRARTTAAG